MICQCCYIAESVAVRGRGPHRLRLCIRCLAKSGLHHLSGWELWPERVHSAEPGDSSPAALSADELRCPTCFKSIREFCRSVRYGCVDCRRTFLPQLEKVLKALHSLGGGEVSETRSLREVDLSLALLLEDYELAARIRDEMAQHQPSGET